MAGPAVFLPAKLAVTMALSVHELATNAAKYRALSFQGGVVSIYWSISDYALELFWSETGAACRATDPSRIWTATNFGRA
jgi:two-component sensor histidine kinase